MSGSASRATTTSRAGRDPVPEGGPEATRRALERVEDARVIVLVEGISDQVAIEALAVRRGRDLDSEGVRVVPIGGAHAARKFLALFGPQGANKTVAGLCDVGEEGVFRRGLERAGFEPGPTRADLERLGFHVCVVDLEDELIRAHGAPSVESVLESRGDLGAFRMFQNQPAWRGRKVEDQLRRFLTSSDRRKLRYVRLLVETLEVARMPRPLDGVLSHTRT